jgi:galactose-1-phosphate uridylyltransferase
MIDFRIEKKLARIHDPRKGFELAEIESEVRYDPLTGESARICHFALKAPPPTEIGAIVELSQGQCPFCPERVETVTPRFPEDLVPGGRLRRGGAIVAPNLFPYDDVSAIAVLGRDHFVPMDQVPAQLVIDGLTAARDFMRLAQKQVAGGEGFGIVTWNYMPPAGATQVHPHMQVIVSRNPGNALRRSLDAAARYRARSGRCYHADLVATERARGERWIGEAGAVAWLAPFTPTGLLGDVAAVFRERATVTDLDDADIADFAQSLVRVLAALAARGLWSFNLCLMPAPFGERADRHWLTAKLLPRIYLNPKLHVSDVAYLHLLLEERFAMLYPEEVAAGLRPALGGIPA